MKNWFKFTIAAFIVALVSYCIYLNIQVNQLPTIIYQHDTTIVERFNTEVKCDTVIKWYDRIQWKESKPDVVYFDRADSVFIDKVQDLDVMLSVKKQDDELHIFALNQNNKVLKQYLYKYVGNDFIATSQHGNVFVKSKNWYFTGFKFNAEYNLPFQNINKDFYKQKNYRLSFESGISFRNQFDMNLGLERDFNTGDNSIKLKLSYNVH